jgi:hypothetical protein
MVGLLATSRIHRPKAFSSWVAVPLAVAYDHISVLNHLRPTRSLGQGGVRSTNRWKLLRKKSECCSFLRMILYLAQMPLGQHREQRLLEKYFFVLKIVGMTTVESVESVEIWGLLSSSQQRVAMAWKVASLLQRLIQERKSLD